MHFGGCRPAMRTDRAHHLRGRVVAISAGVGAGHDGATRELTRRLMAMGFEVDCHDFMQLLPWRLGSRALHTHGAVLCRAPWIYGALFAIGNRYRITTSITRGLLYPIRRRVLRLLTEDVRAVVSTYPLASQVLGPLRRSGQLTVPAITYATDFAVHRHWVAPGVDAHLAPHPVGAAQAQALGARGARVGGALVAPGFRPVAAVAKHEARQKFGLPSGRLALVGAGSWGVGEIEAAAAEIAATGEAVPVVVCGKNAALKRRLLRRGMRYTLGWVDDMPTLMQAVDVLVENAGGLMALEGMACALPVMTYRPIPGHGTESAAALAQAGIATWVQDEHRLGRVLVELAEGMRGRHQRGAALVLFEPDAAETIADLATGGVPADVDSRSVVLRRVRRGAAMAASVAIVLAVAGYRTRRPR
jgi:processive 1,2-diacylglycerol beta-glucosyltransferase